MRTRQSAQSRAYLLSTGLFAIGFVVLSTAMVWPIYKTPYLFVTTALALVGAVGIALLYTVRSWSLFRISLAAIVYFVVLGVPATTPEAFSSLPSFFTGWLDTISSAIFGWKQLVTISLPVGTYQSLLVPYFILIFLTTAISLTVAWNRPRQFWVVVPLMGLPVVFAIAFGALDVSTRFTIGGVTLPISLGMLAGFVELALAVSYMTWGIAHSRNSAREGSLLATASRQTRNKRLRRTGIKVAVFSAAGVVIFALVSTAGISPSRTVLRSAVDPRIERLMPVSPLSLYREAYTNPDLYSATWLKFTSAGELPERIRLAVLPYFDGQVFRVVPVGGEKDENSVFSRVPTAINPEHQGGTLTDISVVMGENSGLWMPSVGGLNSVTFEGKNQADLTDGFFYNRATNAGIVIPELSAQDTFVLHAYVGEQTPQLATAGPDQLNTTDPTLIPESLTKWVDLQGVSGDGNGLETLIKRLRARGYLSHSLTAPAAESGNSAWTTALPGYSFKPSLAGHSTGRVGDLFQQLIDKQQTASDQTNDALLVAAVGDDEQFAAAAALLANYLGYNSRVVVGFHTVDIKQDGYVIPACEEGICTGANLTAWVEIETNDGWVAVETTPQYKNPIAPESQDRQDPQNPTQVDPQNASNLPPPEADPANGDAGNNATTDSVDLTWLVDLLKNIAIVLLLVGVLISPFALIIGSKIHRRKVRRNNETTTYAIAGAWEEFVDTAIDYGYSLPQAQTRTELVRSYGLPRALRLAELTDVAVFGPKVASPSAVQEAWDEADVLRLNMREASPRTRRIIATLSLKSFVRYFGPQTLSNAGRGFTSLAQGQASAAGSSLKAFGGFFTRQLKKVTKR